MDIGAVSRAAELVERLAQAIRVHLDAAKKATRWLGERASALGGLEVGGTLRLPESKGPSWPRPSRSISTTCTRGSRPPSGPTMTAPAPCWARIARRCATWCG